MEVELRGEYSSLLLAEPGEVTVPARKLFDIVRALNGWQWNCSSSSTGERLQIKAGRSRFTC